MCVGNCKSVSISSVIAYKVMCFFEESGILFSPYAGDTYSIGKKYNAQERSDITKCYAPYQKGFHAFEFLEDAVDFFGRCGGFFWM